MSDNLLTIPEASKLLKVHYQTVRNYIKQGKLPSFKVGKTVRVKHSDVLQMLQQTKAKKPLNELEMRFLCNRREKIEKVLLNKGAKVVYMGHIIDHWFVPNYIKNLKQKDEYYDSGKGFGLRVRQQDNGYTGKITTTLEVKRLVTPYKHEHCIEGEIDINSYEETRNLLNLMNFKEFLTIDKDRLVYKYNNNLKVVIDDIKDFGTGVEIEMITSKAKDEVWGVLQKTAKELTLNLKTELVEKSVTYLAMKKLANFG